MLEEKSGKPVVGVLPYLTVDIEEEDSLVRGVKIKPEGVTETDTVSYRESQYELLAAAIREHLDMKFIYSVLEGKV